MTPPAKSRIAVSEKNDGLEVRIDTSEVSKYGTTTIHFESLVAGGEFEVSLINPRLCSRSDNRDGSVTFSCSKFYLDSIGFKVSIEGTGAPSSMAARVTATFEEGTSEFADFKLP